MTAPAPFILRIVEGEVEVSDREDAVLSTVVGSCVAACLWDPARRVGGMNHFLLPGDSGIPPGALPGPPGAAPLGLPLGAARRHGVHLMELLINRLMGMGADRRRLQAKVFGGAAMRRGLTEAGARNGEFVEAFLAREGIPLVGRSLGGTAGRRVEFWPATGRARFKPTGIDEAAPVRPAPRSPPPGALPGEPEFF